MTTGCVSLPSIIFTVFQSRTEAGSPATADRGPPTVFLHQPLLSFYFLPSADSLLVQSQLVWPGPRTPSSWPPAVSAICIVLDTGSTPSSPWTPHKNLQPPVRWRELLYTDTYLFRKMKKAGKQRRKKWAAEVALIVAAFEIIAVYTHTSITPIRVRSWRLHRRNTPRWEGKKQKNQT